MTEVIDYAYPMMMAEKKMKQAHHAALERDYTSAMELTMQAMADLRIAYISFQHMKDTER